MRILDRVILDANAILNAAFIPNSWSRLVVQETRKNGGLLFAGLKSLEEAFSTARTIAERHHKVSDPASVINAFIRHFDVSQVEPSFDEVEAEIPAHDHHVVREAITAAATILTSDAKLWRGCKVVSRNAVLPIEALGELFGKDQMGLFAFGIAPTRIEGSIFMRVHPGSWAKSQNIGKFSVAENHGALWLYYCTDKRHWALEVPGINPIVIPAEFSEQEMQTIAVSWKADNSLMLRVGSSPDPATNKLHGQFPVALSQSFNLGHKQDGSCYWNGWINVFVMNDRAISKDIWRLCASDEILTPNPFDSDRLEYAIVMSLR